MTLLPLEWLYDRLTLSSEIKIISSYFLIIWRQLNVHFLIAFIANLHLFLEKTKYIVFCKEAFLRFSCTYTTMYVKLKKKYTLSPIISLLTLEWLKATKSIKKSPFFIHHNVTSKGVTHWQTKPLGISNFAISIHLCITISNTCTIWVLKYSLKFAPKICFFNFIFHKQQRTIRKIYILSYPKGRQYDKDGNLKQWWTDDVIQKFKTQAQCLIDQYGDFSVPEADGMKVSRAQSEFPLNTLYRIFSL